MLPRFSLLLFALLIGLGAVSRSQAEDAAYVPNPSGFKIQRGVNLSHWLSQCFEGYHRDTYIVESDFAFIRSIGYDHVRIPIDEIEFWTADGKAIESAFAVLDQALAWSRAHGLRAIVDLHTVRAHHFNAENEGMKNTLFTDEKAQDAFIDLWKQLSSRLKDNPVDQVAYEIMNEPVADNPEQWNQLIAKSHAVLRKLEPKRVLVIGSNRWQSAETFPDLRVPEGDLNIILSVHSYEPFALTHYKANWTPLGAYAGPVQYPGVIITPEAIATHVTGKAPELLKVIQGAKGDQAWDRARLESVLMPAIKRARELKRQLYCGEFGCLPSGPREARLQYYRDIRAVFDAHGMAWANWEYKADFGIIYFDPQTQKASPPDRELIEILLGKK